MDLCCAAKELGIEPVPQGLLNFYEAKHSMVSPLKLDLIDILERDFSLLGTYEQPLRATAKTVLKCPALCLWAEVVSAYTEVTTISELSAVPMPRRELLVDAPYYLLLILCMSLPTGIELYRVRGFSDAEIRAALSLSIRDRVSISEEVTGDAGLDRGGFNWLLHYVKALVFPAGIFNVTPRALYDSVLLLRSCEDGSFAVLMTSGRFHRSGMPLGSGGCHDAEGAFDADFRETEEAYEGHVIRNGRVLPQMRAYPKHIWKKVAGKGDGIVGIHIPRGAALTEENIENSFALAFRLCRERYPEVDVRAIHCASWMLDPQLKEMLGNSSKIAGFLDRFLEYPQGGDGSGVYHFVFRCQKPEELSLLPENTTLQKKVKQLYIDGGCIYAVGGFVAKDEYLML